MLESFLNREECIEQAYFFRVFRERLAENLPSQEILESIREEILAITRLPLAIDFLRGEILLTGKIADGMARLAHYFRPFQSYVMMKAEEEKSRFDQTTALLVLQREAEYLAGEANLPGLFIYQFECISRNRLGYDEGMKAIAADPHFPAEWSDWILKSRRRLGTTDLADMIYYRSRFFVDERRLQTRRDDYQPAYAVLFGVQEGRIAKANRGRDPMHMFAALQRQLDYPAVPRIKPKREGPLLHPAVEQRIKQMEQRIQLLESEVKGDIDLSQFYAKPPDFAEFDDEPAG